MNDAQIWKYRAEWGKAWKALRAAGTPAKDQEATRKRWHVLIGAVYLRGPEIGQPKSSKVLTNSEFDRFLKRCTATHTPAGLAEQLALDDQPLIRLQHATDPLLDLVKMKMEDREAYLGGIYANIQRPRATKGERVYTVAEMPDADLQLVVIALTHTVEHKLGAGHNHPRVGKGPKSRFDHEVGAKTGQNPASQTTASRTISSKPVEVPVETEDDGDPF